MAKSPDPMVDLNAFSEAMRRETDRACGVLGAALLDEKLEQLFVRGLRHSHDELLKGLGPLASFSARIRTAHALAWISDPAAADLNVVRSIRNKFAHEFDHTLSFDHQSISAQSRNLKTAQAYLDGYDDPKCVMRRNYAEGVILAMRDTFSSPRWRYELTVHFLSQHLDEIKAPTMAYAGPDILKECHELSAGRGITMRMEGTSRGPLTPPGA